MVEFGRRPATGVVGSVAFSAQGKGLKFGVGNYALFVWYEFLFDEVANINIKIGTWSMHDKIRSRGFELECRAFELGSRQISISIISRSICRSIRGVDCR